MRYESVSTGVRSVFPNNRRRAQSDECQLEVLFRQLEGQQPMPARRRRPEWPSLVLERPARLSQDTAVSAHVPQHAELERPLQGSENRFSATGVMGNPE